MVGFLQVSIHPCRYPPFTFSLNYSVLAPQRGVKGTLRLRLFELIRPLNNPPRDT